MEDFENILEFSADLFDTVFSLGINYAAYVKRKRELEEYYKNYHWYGSKEKASFEFWEGFNFGPLGLHDSILIIWLFPFGIVYTPLLMLTGKIAKYSIGYPIAALAYSIGVIADIILEIIGGLIATWIQVKEAFENRWRAAINRYINIPRELRAPTPAAIPALTPIETPELQLARRAFAEKKDVLQRKLTSLTQLIDNEIARLNPLCAQHEQVIQEIERLTLNLSRTESEKYAEKFSHYQTHERVIYGCECGINAGTQSCCMVCRTPKTKAMSEKEAVYIADNKQRTRAFATCAKIEAELNPLLIQKANPPSAYIQRTHILEMRGKLANINIAAAQEEKSLAIELEKYKNILTKEVTPYFSEHHPTTFSEIHYLPTSQNAELMKTLQATEFKESTPEVKSMLSEERRSSESKNLTLISPDLAKNEEEENISKLSLK